MLAVGLCGDRTGADTRSGADVCVGAGRRASSGADTCADACGRARVKPPPPLPPPTAINLDPETQALIAKAKRTVFLIPFSHWDADWHDAFPAYSRRAATNIVTAIQIAKRSRASAIR